MRSARHASAGHRPPEVVAGTHLLHQLALPLVLHFDTRGVARLACGVGAVGELVGPLAVLADQDDACALLADVLDDRLRAAVSEKRFLPEEWRRVGTLSDWEIRLTPTQADALVASLVAILEEASDSTEEVAVPFAVNLNAFPRPGSVPAP